MKYSEFVTILLLLAVIILGILFFMADLNEGAVCVDNSLGYSEETLEHRYKQDFTCACFSQNYIFTNTTKEGIDVG